MTTSGIRKADFTSFQNRQDSCRTSVSFHQILGSSGEDINLMDLQIVHALPLTQEVLPQPLTAPALG